MTFDQIYNILLEGSHKSLPYREQDLDLYDQLKKEMGVFLDKKDITNPEYLNVCRRFESLRKKYKGMSPSQRVSKIAEAFDKEKKQGLHGWFSRNKGKGWIDCKTGKPCGRQKGEKRKGYPACRPTKAMCNSRAKLKKGPKRISWKKKK